MSQSSPSSALTASAIDAHQTQTRHRVKVNELSTPIKDTDSSGVESVEHLNTNVEVQGSRVVPPAFFGQSYLSDAWLESRLLPNKQAPFNASSFRKPGKKRPITFKNSVTAMRLLFFVIPHAIRTCARDQRIRFSLYLLLKLEHSISPFISMWTIARLFDLVQEALTGSQVTVARLQEIAVPALAYKIGRALFSFVVRRNNMKVNEKIITNFQERYLMKQLYADMTTLSEPYTHAVFYESEVMVGFAPWLTPTGTMSSGGPQLHIHYILCALQCSVESILGAWLMAWKLRGNASSRHSTRSSMLFVGLALAPICLTAITRMARVYKPQGSSPRVSRGLQEEATLIQDLGSNGPYKQEVLIYSLQRFVIERWRSLRSRTMEHKKDTRKLEPLFTALNILDRVTDIGIYSLIALYNRELNITLGSLRLYHSLNKRISHSVSTMILNWKRAYQFIFVLTAFVLLERMSEDAVEESHASVDGKLARRCPMRIEAKDLSFTYPGTDVPVLKDINLTIEPGQSVAIVGFNGGGKTTLIKVLMGLYKPSGTLLIDGVSSSLISPTDLYRRAACLFQDYAKYPLTLAENVGLGQSDLSLPALEDAIVSGGAEGVLAKVGLNGRLSMTSVADYEVAAPSPTLKVGEKPDVTDKAAQAAILKGSCLSGGQWQRVALARAFMKAATADLVVFEIHSEPSSALDPKAEANLFDRIHKLAHGTDGHRATTIYVSHRFATVRRADKIAVVEDGTIIEFGSHDELMARNGRYKELFEISARGFN